MTVSRDEVIFAYKLLLDRLPESESVIELHTHVQDLQELLRNFLGGQEFVTRFRPRRIDGLPLNVPPIRVESDASETDVGRCLAVIRDTWTHLGKVRPYFSVLTDSQFLPEQIHRSAQEFWRTGEEEAQSVEEILRRHGCDDLASRTCVEFGCGVGRVTTALARRCALVHAYDISATHLALAISRARETGATNIAFHLCTDNLLDVPCPCDLFYSTIVFQHNPPVIISRLIRNALKSLRPMGLALFQVPTYELGYNFSTAEWLGKEHELDMQMHCLPQTKIFEIVAEEHCSVLEVREDDCAGPRNHRISNSFVIRKPR